MIFERFELRLRVRIVIGDVGPAVGLGDLQIDQQGGHRFRAHTGAAVDVQGERAGDDVVFRHGLGDQVFGKLRGFTQGDHPAHHVAAEDIEDHVQVIAAPFTGPLSFTDVPAPDLVGLHRQQLRCDVGRVDTLMAPLVRAARGREQAVHGAHRAQVVALVEGRGAQSATRSLYRISSNTRRSDSPNARGARGRGVGGLGELSRRRRRASWR